MILDLSFDTGDVSIDRINQAFGTAYQYQTTVADPKNPGSLVLNPETPLAFTQRMVAAYVSSVVKATEVKEAIVTATASVQAITLTKV